MGHKTVQFSDLSGQLMTEDGAPARIVVHEHPELADGPVELDALADEARAIEKAALQVAVVDLCFPDETQPRRVVVDADVFGKLATDTPMGELLATARPAKRASRSAAAAIGGGRVNYASLEHAGKPHKGKTTDAEQRLVREHFDEINERLAAAGHRRISLSDPDHIERYGLAPLAQERGAAIAPETP